MRSCSSLLGQIGSIATLTMMSAPAAAGERATLLLEVRLNGRSTGLIVPFERDASGELSTSGAELAGLRITAPGGAGTATVRLREVAGLTYHYIDAEQAVALTIAPGRLAAARIDAASDDGERAVDIAPGTGAVLGYSLFAGASSERRQDITGIGSAALNARIYSRLGEAAATGVVTTDAGGLRALRLDSRLSTIAGSRLLLTGGDSITNSLPWSRSIRFAGMQVQRDFALRPDLVTVPLPSVSGSAAVPSSLDLYLNGVHRLSTQVPAGRFELDNLPAITGSGDARIVLRDIQGREIETRQRFFVSGRQLRKGVHEFSLEGGVPRQNYGVTSWGYGPKAFVAGTGRIGVSDRVTLEAHGELSANLLLGGSGLTLATGRFGVLSLAAAGSRTRQGMGGLLYGSYDLGIAGLHLSTEVIATSSRYTDLAATSVPRPRSVVPAFDYIVVATRPPAITMRASASIPTSFAGGNMSFSYAAERRRDAADAETVAGHYGRNLSARLSFQGSFLVDLKRRRSASLFAGLSLSLGPRTSATVGASKTGPRRELGFDVSRTAAPEPGSVGWRVSGLQGHNPFRTLAVQRRGARADAQAQISHGRGAIYGNIGLDGALVVDGGVFATRPLSAAFAIVEAGVANVPVLHQNQRVGRTNGRGRMLVPNVRSFEPSRLALDIDGLPHDMAVASPSRLVRPSGFGGVRVAFDVTRARHHAVMHLVDVAGADIPPGSIATTQDGTRSVVGYDGLIMVESSQAHGGVSVRTRSGSCLVRVGADAAVAQGGLRPIGPLTCMPALTFAARSRP